MRPPRVFLACALAANLAACGHPAARAPSNPAAFDEGTFAIRVGDVDAGEEHFTVRRGSGAAGDWTFDSTFHVSTSQFQVDSKNHLVTDAQFRPRAATLNGVINGLAFSQRLGGGPPLSLEYVQNGEKSSKVASADVDAFFPDNSVIHMTMFCNRDARAASIMVFPGIQTAVGPATTLPAEAGGLTVRVVQATGAGPVVIYCDGDKLAAANAATINMTAIRRGDEARYAQAQPKPRAPRQKPAMPPELAELERNLTVDAGHGADGATLACSLVVPVAMKDVAKRPATGALPAVLLLSDYGPEDRDDDAGAGYTGGARLSLEKTMAIALGRAGIASLRCDDRGTGGSGGDYMKMTLDSLAADAAAELDLLRAEPAIDPDRLGIVGHGEGGVIAPMLARDRPWLRALALYAANGRPLDVALLEQDQRYADKQAGTAEQKQQYMAQARATFDAIRRGAPLPADTPGAQQIEVQRAWLASHFAHDPAATAAKLAAPPVLIAQGDLDTQIFVGDAEALRDAFTRADNKGVEYHLYAGLHHYFARAITGDLADLADPKAVIEPRVLTDLVAFLRAHL